MAKRKLTPEQRDQIRREIAKKSSAGTPRADVLKATAKKYGITPESVRWYLDGKKAKKKPKARKPSEPNKASRLRHEKRSRVTARRTASPHGNGPLSKLVHSVKASTERAMKRVREAEKLIPRWQAQVRLEQRLRTAASRITRQLREARSSAKRLARRIKRLTTG